MPHSNRFARLLLTSSTLLACAVIAPLASQAAEPASEADKAFAAKVSQGGMYEVEASKVAEKMARAQDVSNIASAEVHDHELVNAKLKNIATAEGITVEGKLNAEFQTRLDRLKSHAGSAFDAEYISDMQQIHDKDEKLFAQEAMEGTAGFKGFAHETDMVVKRHIGALHGTDH